MTSIARLRNVENTRSNGSPGTVLGAYIDAGFFSGATCANFEEAMRELNIDVDEGKGKKVRIFCE